MGARIRAAAAVLLLACNGAPAAWAARQDEPGSARPDIAGTYGKTLPPIGFVEFCARVPEACMARLAGETRPHLAASQWDMVYRVNAFVNAQVKPATDQDVYGEPEHWSYPRDAGDCEDYALLKQRYLEELGIARSALLLTVVLDDRLEGHAVLTLTTSEGDFILDNRRNTIRRWRDVDYTYLKRQSQRDPREWISLSRTRDGTGKALAIRSTRP